MFLTTERYRPGAIIVPESKTEPVISIDKILTVNKSHDRA